MLLYGIGQRYCIVRYWHTDQTSQMKNSETGHANMSHYFYLCFVIVVNTHNIEKPLVTICTTFMQPS
jgi:hypothetical protein